MTSRRRRWSFRLLLGAAAAGAAWWALRIPPAAGRAARAVPAEATWVCASPDLAGRWDELAANSLVRRALEPWFGKEGLDALAEDRPLRARFRLLASGEFVLASVPVWDPAPGGPRRAADWAAVAGVGRRGYLLRWAAVLGRVPGLQRTAPYHGRPVWRGDVPRLGPERALYVTQEEGLLFASVGRSPAALHRLLDAYDGLVPRFDWPADAPADGEVLAWAVSRADAAGRRARVDLQWAGTGGVGLAARFRPLGLPPARSAGATDLAGLAPIWRDAPHGVLTADAAAWARLLPPAWADSAVAREAAGLLEACGAERVVVGLFGDPHAGRFRGIKVPGLVVAARVRDEAVARTAVDALLDRLNAERQWGLIAAPRPTTHGDDLRVVEGTGDTPYARAPEEERLAFLVTNGWLQVSTSAAGLRGLLEQPAGDAARLPAWTAMPMDAPAAAWFDLERAVPTVRLGLSVWALRLIVEDREGTAGRRAAIESAKGWLDALAPMSRLSLELRRRGDGCEVVAVAGPGVGVPP